MEKHKWNETKINFNIDLTLRFNDWVIQLDRKVKTSSFVWLNKTIMQCLFKEVQHSYISSKMLQYQTADVFKYWCLIGFAYVYQVNTI